MEQLRFERITYYCSLFERIYGEQPAGDLSSFTDEEIEEAIKDLEMFKKK